MGIWNKTVEMHLICTFENLSSVFSWFSSPIMIILDYSRIFTRKRVLKIYIFCIIQILKLPLLLETARNKSNGWETVLPINIKVTVEYRYIRFIPKLFLHITFGHLGPLMCRTISHPFYFEPFRAELGTRRNFCYEINFIANALKLHS